MRTLLRLATVLLGSLLLLLVVAALILPRLVDPNDFRGHIEAAVEDATGRDLTIEGNVELNFLPWLGIRLGAVELGPDPDFAQPDPFARISEAEIRIRVLPLFLGRAEVGTLVLDGLRLNLARDANGRGNWEDLAGEAAPPESESAPAVAEERASDVTRDPLEAISLGGIRITDAAASWSDATTGESYRVENLAVESGPIASGTAVPLVIGADLISSQPKVRARLELQTSVELDPGAPAVTSRNLTLSITAEGEPLGPSPIRTKLAWQQAGANLATDTAEIHGLRLDAPGAIFRLDMLASNLSEELRSEGDFALEFTDPSELTRLLPEPPPIELGPLEGSRLQSEFLVDLAFDRAELHGLGGSILGSDLAGYLEVDRLQSGEPTYGGSLALEPMDPGAIAADLGIELPPMADDRALSNLELKLAFDGSTKHFMTEQLELRLDDTTVTGQAGLARFAPPKLHFNLVVDELDLDRYLPPEDTTSSDAEPATDEASADSPFVLPDFDLPVEPLRRFDALGTARVDHLRAAGLRLANLRLDLQAEDGRIAIAPFRTDLYDGQLILETHLDATGDALGVELLSELSGFQAAPLLVDLTGEPHVSGRTDLSIDIQGRGTTFRQLRRGLDGEVLLNFRNGAIQGVNFAELITTAWARIEDQEPPQHQSSATDFTALAASIDIRDGLATNNDLALQTPGLRVAGSGSLHLASEAVDYELRAAVVRSLEGQGGASIDELTDLTIPIHIGGTLKDIEFQVQLRELLEMQAREAAQRALEREQERLESIRREAEQRLEREQAEARRRMEEAEAKREAQQHLDEAEKRLQEEQRRQQERMDRESEKLEDRARDLFKF